MAKNDAEVTVRVKNEYIQVVDGKPGDLFVMKLDKPICFEQHKRILQQVGGELERKFPGSRLMVLPAEITSIRHLSEEDLNEAGYFKKDD